VREGGAAEFAGHLHEAGFYGSDTEFRSLIVPFVEEGIDAGEPVIIGYDERKSALLQQWLEDPSPVAFITDSTLYSTPARAIATYRRLFEQHVAAGARQIRIAGDVPHPGNGGRFEGWDRYESAVNTVWDDFPARSVCLYDATTVSPTVREVVERTHPYLLTPNGERRANSRYDPTPAFVGLAATVDPLEASRPVVELHDASPAEVRRTLHALAHGRLDDHTLDDLVLGASEAASNALIHGKPPTTVRIWTAETRVIVHVCDSGQGPTDRLAGLVPVTNSPTGGGLGLWLAHQLDIDVALIPGPDGFTIRLRSSPPGS
jgi:anti-sigma regulatory factor (Ser/Thr protein kinase)